MTPCFYVFHCVGVNLSEGFSNLAWFLVSLMNSKSFWCLLAICFSVSLLNYAVELCFISSWRSQGFQLAVD